MLPLDNPVWHALTGPHEKVAEGRSRAIRYVPDVAPFSALPDEPDESAWHDLGDLIGRGGVAVLFSEPPGRPKEWEIVFSIPTIQMVGTAVAPAAAAGVELLGPGDVDDMLALVERTRPGPFAHRTIELGEYLGVRDEDGTLVAMAGMRVHLPGHVEISAVCTDEHWRGRGVASALVRDLAGRITDRAELPILHVVESNTGAIRVYERLGFEVRRTTQIIGVRAPE